jgi:hydroxyquinol 1,2-dioxygenase
MVGGGELHGRGDTMASLDALEARLAALAPSRLVDGLGILARSLRELLEDLRPTPAELRAVIDFLTETGHHADARRQEWVLLADALGISSAVHEINLPHRVSASQETVCGPFYRAGAPEIAPGQNICRDGRGEPLRVSGTVRAASGARIVGALVEVWHANAEGLYENQEPDRQPEHNLRGCLRTGSDGEFYFLSIKPSGYRLPVDGPVGRLLTSAGLPVERPAHINLRVSAKGYETLTTHVFDKADPAIGRDAIFGVRPELLAEFRAVTNEEGAVSHALDINLVLNPCGGAQPMPGRSST